MTELYDYHFAVWPDEENPRWHKPIFDLFRLLNTRCVMEFTEHDFNNFREDLFKLGFTLREIGRSLHQPLEIIL